MIGDFEAIATAGWRGPNHTFSTYSLLKRFCAIKFGPPQTTKASFHKNHWTLFYCEIIVSDYVLFFWFDRNVLRCRNWMFFTTTREKRKIVENIRIAFHWYVKSQKNAFESFKWCFYSSRITIENNSFIHLRSLRYMKHQF